LHSANIIEKLEDEIGKATAEKIIRLSFYTLKEEPKELRILKISAN
jgi:hypothetical protein